MSVPIRGFLKNRRDRAVGTILGYVEREMNLSEDVRLPLRRVVLSAMDGYHDSVLDLVKADEDVVRNDEVIDLLERIDKRL